ncbi:MAG: MoxR family ATPase [Eubacterium sp.]|nr:MoxR family ATPase [Eubacterium sp.]MBQ7424792.1 MoxR family ATPase [Lachnospiraceae bacterium]MBR1674713.1 MoxR family ATPase [Eubacterium sp.]
MDYSELQQRVAQCEAEIAKEIIGQRDVVRTTLLALLTGGNVLLEGMPGLGKTRLVNTISKVVGLSFKRIQFTPDLMPGDITGTNIIEHSESGNNFRFEPGPIFANLILADEVNRATPKTQSALLEAMQEHTVTVGNTSYMINEPFFVLATENPIETEGTYPLPEAQLDRFMFKILVPFPTKEELRGIVGLTEGNTATASARVIDRDTLLAVKEAVKTIPIADAVMDRILDIIMATHADNKFIREGVSPRAAQAVIRGAKARAFMEGRYNVSFEDVEYAVYPALRHRLVLSFDAVSDGITADKVIDGILGK